MHLLKIVLFLTDLVFKIFTMMMPNMIITITFFLKLTMKNRA